MRGGGAVLSGHCGPRLVAAPTTRSEAPVEPLERSAAARSALRPPRGPLENAAPVAFARRAHITPLAAARAAATMPN